MRHSRTFFLPLMTLILVGCSNNFSPFKTTSYSKSDLATQFYSNYKISLKGADKDNNEFGGSSDVDKLLTYIGDETKEDEVVKMAGGERFFLVFVKKDSASAIDLYYGLKEFRDSFGKTAEFKDLNGNFRMLSIFTDEVSDDDENLFDMAWRNHYSLFENMANGNFLPCTPYAINNNYSEEKYALDFLTEASEDNCPMTTPLVMYFNYSDDYVVENQKVNGLSDVLFSVEGSDKLEKARTLKRCWAHTDEFREIQFPY